MSFLSHPLTERVSKAQFHILTQIDPKAKPPEMPPFEVSKTDAENFPPAPPRKFIPAVESTLKKLSEPKQSTSTIQAAEEKAPEVPPKLLFRKTVGSDDDTPVLKPFGVRTPGGGGLTSPIDTPKLPIGAFNPLTGRPGMGLHSRSASSTPTLEGSPRVDIKLIDTPTDDKPMDKQDEIAKENAQLKKQIETEKENAEYLTQQLGDLRQEISKLKKENQTLEKVNSDNSLKLKEYETGKSGKDENMKKITSLLETISQQKQDYENQIADQKRQFEEEKDRLTRKLTLQFETEKKEILERLERSSKQAQTKGGDISDELNKLKLSLEEEKKKRVEEVKEWKEQVRSLIKRSEFDREQLRPIMNWLQERSSTPFTPSSPQN